MPLPLLHELLEAGLLDIGENDKAFSALDAATNDLAERFRKAPKDAIQATLVVLDEQITATDPALVWAKEAVVAHWPMVVNRLRDEPRHLLRMILFAALARAAAKVERLSLVCALTAVGALRYRKLGAREGPILKREIESWALRGEAWGTPEVSTQRQELPPVPTWPSLKIDAPQVSVDAGNLRAALGPGAEGRTDVNPHWPTQPPAWANEASQRLAKELGATATNAMAALAKNVMNSWQQLSDVMAKQVADQMAVLQKLASRPRVEELKATILWWREALYSPSLRTSYRALDPIGAVVAMAHDLHALTASPVPASTAYLLAEAVRHLVGKESEAHRPISDLATQLAQHREQVLAAVQRPTPGEGRISLGAGMAAVVHGGSVEANVQARVGLEPQARLSLVDLAMIGYWDLTAQQLAATP